ncbi:hypothetical protein Gpo141_00003795 [Globisporangium polare]
MVRGGRASAAHTSASQIHDDDDEFDHHASWLDDDDADDSASDEDGYASDDAVAKGAAAVAKEEDEDVGNGEEQEAVTPWIPDDLASHGDSGSEEEDFEEVPQKNRSDADGEDGEGAGNLSDGWADEYLAMEANSPAVVTSRPLHPTPVATEVQTKERAEPEKRDLTRLFPGYESSINSLRNEISLVEKATEKAAAAAMMPSLPTESTITTKDSDRAASTPPVGTPHQVHAEAPSIEVRVHPLSLAIDKESEHRRKTPLSPNSLKRANSVYVTPTSASKVLMKRQDSLTMTANVSRSQMLWSSESSRRSSRMLDEWKRKEIWHDFKRAEVNFSGPQVKKADVTSTEKTESAAVVSEARLENLLQNLRAEISLSSSASSRAPEVPTPRVSATASNGAGQPPELLVSSAPLPAAAAVVVEPQVQDRRQTIASTLLAEVPMYAVAGCSRSEYEQILQEKRFLVDELENRARVSVADKEIIRNLSERIQVLENSDRENKFLKDEIQKHVMHELTSKERLKTLGDQLALTSKSEEQLKLQTQQLFQQNQSLQSDLLKKIAAEASKIQKMAHLSAEKENLMQELERKDSVSSTRQLQEKEQLQQKTIRRLLRVKRLSNLRAAMGKWQMSSQRLAVARCRALETLSKLHRLVEMKALAKAFNRLKVNDACVKQQLVVSSLQASLSETSRSEKMLAMQNGLLQLNLVVKRWRTTQLREAFRVLQIPQQQQRRLATSLELGCTKLSVLVLGRLRSSKQHAFDKWKTRAQLDGIRVDFEKAMQSEKDLNEAKDCVFSLSREKTKLEEKLQNSRGDYKRVTDQLTENNAELQVVKHAFVTTVIRDVERGWLRAVFTEWRMQANMSIATKSLRLQSELAELKAAERDKYAKTMDDYNRVLRSDLERFQFFSQDKRIAVDVLTKKLLREEEKYKQMEEHQVALEEKAHSLRSQLSAFLAWEGLELPLSMLSLSKDIAIANLKELFLLHATVTSDPSNGGQPGGLQGSLAISSYGRSNGMDDNAAPRLSMESLLRMIEYSTLLENNQLKKEELAEKIVSHLPDYASERGLLFPDFLVGVNNLLHDLFHESTNKSEQMRAFWGSLLALVDPSRCGGNGSSGGNGREHMLSGRSPWAGRLSDDILQNQEKLLAVLEHETAVVERAVMEKSSLKHTYPSSDHPSVAATFYEYQCDPMLPPEPTHGNASSHLSSSTSPPGYSTMTSPLAVPAEIYTNWYQTAQVRDLFLSFHQPLLKVLMKYSNEKRNPSHGNQFCLQLSGILKMLEDMKLYPSYLSKEVIHHVFGSLCDRDGLLTPQAFTLFLGSCALELYTKSLAGNAKPPAFPLSAREILLSFFCDLGFLAESEAPAPSRICFVGMEIENILWSLFEYYATTDDERAATRAEDERVSMTAAKFTKFMTEIAGGAAGADDMYRRVMNESRRVADTTSGSSPQKQWEMYFDEFYSTIAYVQEVRNKQIAYPNPGEAVRHWMQQTQ